MERPWGLLNWALEISGKRKWFFIGALGAEDRSLAAWEFLVKLGVETGRCLIEVEPLKPSRFFAKTEQKLDERRQIFISKGGLESEIEEIPLLSELHKVIQIAEKLCQSGPAVVLDISSLPKRFFFPVLRSLYQADAIKDLLITYTCPLGYSECLSEKPGPWEHLPGFGGLGTREELLIVGLGFLVESLQQNFSAIEKHQAIQLLIPFPAPLSALRRTWDALYNIRAGPRAPDKFDTHRVGAADLASAFNKILSLTNGTQNVAFAPFGPKPMSAAICLMASQMNSAVYYPQPQFYNPEYSRGVGMVNGAPAVYGYWLKHDGKGLYNIS